MSPPADWGTGTLDSGARPPPPPELPLPELPLPDDDPEAKDPSNDVAG
jgi:hypothetical protein